MPLGKCPQNRVTIKHMVLANVQIFGLAGPSRHDAL